MRFANGILTACSDFVLFGLFSRNCSALRVKISIVEELGLFYSSRFVKAIFLKVMRFSKHDDVINWSVIIIFRVLKSCSFLENLSFQFILNERLQSKEAVHEAGTCFICRRWFRNEAADITGVYRQVANIRCALQRRIASFRLLLTK